MGNSRTIAVCLFFACCAVASLSSCATRVPIGTEFNAESEDHDVVVSLRFVTNRRIDTATSFGDYYGDDHGDLTAGHCSVGFEKNDRQGDVLRIDPAPIESVLRTKGTDSLVIYVHGYGEPFDKSCRRAALMQHKLQLQGRLLLFSWPTTNYLTYAQDSDDLVESLGQLNELLSAAADANGRERVVLIAHSMGSRGVIDAFNLRGDDPGRFSHIVFVAPDIRRDAFIENVEMLRRNFSNILVYMSNSDRALMLSATVNLSGRLGLAKEFDVETERLNLIDVTPAGTNQISGHMYHVFNPGVIEDLRHLLGTEDAGTKRTYRRVPSEQPGFWTLEPARD